MRERERGDDRDECAPAPYREHQADHEQQMVESAEDVPESRSDELTGRVEPPRIERDPLGVPIEREDPFASVGGDDVQRARGPDPEVREPGPEHQVRLRRRDRIHELNVEHRLPPRDRGLVAEWRDREPGKRACKGLEPAVAREGYPRGDYPRRPERTPVGIDADGVGEPGPHRPGA